MASNPVPCGPCKHGKVNTKADIWCNNCDEGLCSTCSSHRQRIKSSRDHKTINIQTVTSYKPPTDLIKAECEAHSQQFNLYCPCHLIPCCDECISTSHSKCTGITSLADVVRETKIEKSKESVEKDINSITHFLDKLVNNKSGNLKRGEQQYETIKKSVSKIRNEINKHLDNLEKKLCKEADTVWSQEKSKLTYLITEIEDKQKILTEMKDDLKTVTNHTSKLQSFLGVHLIEQKVHQFQRYVEEIEDSDRVSEVDIKIKQNDEIEKLLKELQSIDDFGEMQIIKTEIHLKRQKSMRREAQVESQVESQEQSNINNMTINIEPSKGINLYKRIGDMICLMDGRVIVTDEEGKVNIITCDGFYTEKFELPLCGELSSVTEINQDTIAITYPFKRTIKIVHIEKEIVIKNIILDKSCFGLSYSNNSLAVGLCNDEIRIIDLEGNTMNSIEMQSELYLDKLVYCNDRVIYTEKIGKAVYINCVHKSGKQIWQYKQSLSAPNGLCTDTYGNLIVTDNTAERILVISNDGQASKDLCIKYYVEYRPGCICLNKNNLFSGYICDYYGNFISKFNLSYD